MTLNEDAQRRADLKLVRRVLRGDRGALPKLTERLGCIPIQLRGRNAKAGGVFEDHELADLAQDVVLIAWRKLGSFSGQSVLPAWVCLICTFEFQNALRKKFHAPVLLGSARGGGGEAAPEVAGPRGQDPFEYEDVHLGLARIGQQEAVVIRLKHFKGKTFAEISEALQLSQSTVKDRYYRGIAELEPLLADRGPKQA